MRSTILALAAAIATTGVATTYAQTTGVPTIASPRGTAATQVAGKWVTEDGNERYREGKWIAVDYGRPVLRGRTNIFGSGAEYGKAVLAGAPIWRAGANQTTALTTEAPLVFGATTLAPGIYSVFVELKEDGWTLVLSTQPRQEKYDRNEKVAAWGSYNYDPKHDVARVPMKLMKSTVSVEQFTIGFVDMTQQGGSLAMWWDKEFAVVGFKVAEGS